MFLRTPKKTLIESYCSKFSIKFNLGVTTHSAKATHVMFYHVFTAPTHPRAWRTYAMAPNVKGG